MGVPTCLTATPSAHAYLVKMFEGPVSILRLLLSRDETRIIFRKIGRASCRERVYGTV